VNRAVRSLPEEHSSSAATPTFGADADGIGWITFSDPARAHNVLSASVMLRLREAIDEASGSVRDGDVRVVVIRSAKSDSFIAGADVDEIASIEDPAEAEEKIRLGQSIYNELADLVVPTVAAVHGLCLGGGVEMALACDHRIASDSDATKLQLPEVLLGILPAWGGTTRLPRMIGLQAALDMLLTAKRIDARKAKRIGLVAEVFPADLFEAKSREFALSVAEGRRLGSPEKRRLFVRLLDDTWPGRRVVLRTARRRVLADTGGHYPAPLRILDLLSQYLGKSVEQSLAAEARFGAELVVSPVCKNLVHVFRMREDARKGTRLGGSGDAREVSRMGVLGAGVMGGGIAQLAAYNGVQVYMKDIRHDAVTGGLRHAKSLFDKAAERRKLSRREATQRLELISGGLDYHGLAASDVVVEAIVEKLSVKRTVLREAEEHVSERCVLATNTSSLSVDDMAEALERPERLCGMHFFNPVHRMPLVEVVRGTHTSLEAVSLVYQLALKLGKVPVVVRDGPGFLVNRILGPYLNEAGFLLGDGATIEWIDRVAKDFGMPMGPLRLIDEIGIDVSGHAGAALHEALGPRLTPSPVLVALGGTERLGRKGGAGFYRYAKGREKGIDERVYDALGSAVPTPKGIAEEEIRNRLVIAMINEAARVLEDEIVTTARDVDLAMIMGTGFPPFRGGLLRFADTKHPRALLDMVQALHGVQGDRFAPAPLLERLASEDRGFYESFPVTTA
jgi:3-hydroxyacyl-CoA dehydrogenase/enoyl-CoA hydratase/3-hydroxybutyryl-CoA epimerase